MPRIWIRVIRNHRTVQQTTVPTTWATAQEDFNEALHDLDIARPLWLSKHDREFEDFRRTAFLPEHFVEDVRIDRLEMEFIDDTDRKRQSRDPRNQF